MKKNWVWIRIQWIRILEHCLLDNSYIIINYKWIPARLHESLNRRMNFFGIPDRWINITNLLCMCGSVADCCRTARHALASIARARPGVFITSVSKEIARCHTVHSEMVAIHPILCYNLLDIRHRQTFLPKTFLLLNSTSSDVFSFNNFSLTESSSDFFTFDNFSLTESDIIRHFHFW